MTTARDLCTQALDEIGVLGVGQTPLAEDINRVFVRLVRMVAAWQVKRWLIPSLQRIYWNADGSKSYSIGLGGDINIPRPTQIKAAYVIQLNTGSNPVSIALTLIPSFEDYALIAIKDLQSLPDHFFYDAASPLGNFYPWPIPNNQYQLNIIIQNQLSFGSTIIQGEISNAGAAYTDGNYDTVALTNVEASDIGARSIATIGINGGIITSVDLSDGGQDYYIGQKLTVPAASVGGTGNGFEYTVQNIGPNLDTVIKLPEYYEEGLFYNLVLRAAGAYNMPAPDESSKLARSALNTIRKNATQVPTLRMPVAPGLRRGKAFNIFNADGY